MKNSRFARIQEVRPADPVFAERIRICLDSTLPAVIRKTKETGRIDAFRLDWKPGMPNQPHIFWDSDTAKVLEGMAYALAIRPDPELEKIYDEWVDRIVSAQQPDGYLNTHFTVVEPENRWKNMWYDHELYCAGHLMEAAVAGYEALGKRKLLDCLCRYADLIDSLFGREPGKRRGWPGHEEIELALVKLYRATGNERYLALSRYFVNDRGVAPTPFGDGNPHPELQADVPVREAEDAHGHAVRAVYLYAGMADVAGLDQDESLLRACERMFDSISHRRMYVTGGIGSTFAGEMFTSDYDLPNGNAMYAESCAAMGLVQFSMRMFNWTGETRYLDIAELALYNGVLSGISLKGDSFFYTNYLEMDASYYAFNAGARTRQPWFDCSCCPTSFARFLPQIGTFLYSVRPDGVAVNIPAASHASFQLENGTEVRFDVGGRYPYDGHVPVTVRSEGRFALEFRIPAWCGKHSLSLNGETVSGTRIDRDWKPGDTVVLDLDMPVECLRANPKVTADAGRIVLKRGPVVYALESIDQNCPVREILIRTDRPFRLIPAGEGLGGGDVPAIEGEALRESFPADELYSAVRPSYREMRFRAIPYALWQNRGETDMAVWVREARS